MTNCNHSLFSDVFYSSQLGFLVGKKIYGEGGEGGGDFSARICGRKPTPSPFLRQDVTRVYCISFVVFIKSHVMFCLVACAGCMSGM